MTNDLRERDQQQEKTLRRLISIQVAIAAIALLVLVVLGVRIPPLIKTRNNLETNIKADKLEIIKLEQELTSKRHEIESAEKTIRELAEKYPQDSTSQRRLEQEVGPQGKIAIRPAQMKDAYVVVLGSYKRFSGAIQSAYNFGSLTGENIRLLYSISDYYAPVVGPIESRQKAEQELAKIRPKVPDAFVFTSGAFLYEIDLAKTSPNGSKSKDTPTPSNQGP